MQKKEGEGSDDDDSPAPRAVNVGDLPPSDSETDSDDSSSEEVGRLVSFCVVEYFLVIE